EIGDKDGGVRFEILGKVERRGNRLVDVVNFREAEAPERLAIAGGSELRVGIGPGKVHGASGHDPADLAGPVVARVGSQSPQEYLHQVLKRLAPGEDQRPLE